jgi:alpha-amylase
MRPRIALLLFFLLATQFSCGEKAPTATAPLAVERAQPAAPLPPTEWNDEVLYFVIVDRFADGDPSNNEKVDRSAKGTFHGGDLKGLTAHLSEIAELGITAIWITPVVKNIEGFVTGAGFPDWAYHGYWADDFTTLDPRFGTEEDLQTFVAECHKRNIRVLLDVVYNHPGYNSNYLKDPKTAAWLRSEDRGTCGQDDLTSCLSGLPDFKTELPEVADFLMDAHLGLAKRVGLDGFRLDTVKHVDHPFWKEHRSRTRSELMQQFFLLGEVWGGDPQVLDPWFSTDEMDAGFDFSFQGSAISFLKGRGRSVAFDRYLKSREKTRKGYSVSHFLSSHDVPGGLFQLEGDKQLFRLAAIVQFTSIGIPMVFYGEEVGRAGGDWPDNRSDMPWGDRNILPGSGQPRDETLRADYAKLIKLRREHPALWRGLHTGLNTEGDALVYAMDDAESQDSVIVAINRGPNAIPVRVPLPGQWSGKKPRDVWSGTAVESKGSQLTFTIDPKSARILVAE